MEILYIKKAKIPIKKSFFPLKGPKKVHNYLKKPPFLCIFLQETYYKET
jgi:hypothetical protein